MSIDGIGRPPRPPGDVGSVPNAAGAGEPQKPFQLDAATPASAATATGPLARLERGEITVDQYLDARVEEAVKPFESKLNAESLDFLRSSLRQELATDPVLIELVRRATGTTLGASEP